MIYDYFQFWYIYTCVTNIELPYLKKKKPGQKKNICYNFKQKCLHSY